MSCTYFDQAWPGTGPPALVSAPSQTAELAKYDDSFNLSLRSRSDFNLNPQPEGMVTSAFPKSEQNREGYFAVETDRGELSATAYTQVNVSGQKSFQTRLQDELRPTMKETTLYVYEGQAAPLQNKQSVYSQFYPSYANLDGKSIRIGGASNFGLKSATDYSYFSTPGPTSMNGSVISNPDARIGKNTKPVPDFNVEGASTLYGAIPNGSHYQQYRLITKPTASGRKFDYNLETEGDSLPEKQIKSSFTNVTKGVPSEWNGRYEHDFSPLLGKKIKGIENRYTASYQIAPLLTNPLTVVWDPDNKGEVPAFYGLTDPADYAYMNQKPLPPDEFIEGGYNSIWQNDKSKCSSNAYILNIEKGVHNDRIEWKQGINTSAGAVMDRQDTTVNALPDKTYGGKYSVFDQYLRNEKLPFYDGTYTTLGDPLAGMIGQSVNQLKPVKSH